MDAVVTARLRNKQSDRRIAEEASLPLDQWNILRIFLYDCFLNVLFQSTHKHYLTDIFYLDRFHASNMQTSISSVQPSTNQQVNDFAKTTHHSFIIYPAW